MDSELLAAMATFGASIYGGRTLVLPTTRVFFDKVLSGSKKFEYRKDAPFYDRLLAKSGATELILHYRFKSRALLYCSIDSIQKIDRPPELAASKFITTDRCYAIAVTNPRLVPFQATKS